MRAVDDGLLSPQNRRLVLTADTPGELLDLFATDDLSPAPKWD